MEKLTQELTSAEGFCKVINENAGEVKATMIREVELEDGTVVKVEGMTPEAIKNVLGVSFKTPGEPVQSMIDGSIINGVAQVYNEAAPAEEEVVPANFNVEVGKTYKVTFNETMTLPEDIIDFISGSVIQLENTDETAGSVILGAGYMLGITGAKEDVPYTKTYMNEAIKAHALAMFNEDDIVMADNTTEAEGWKEVVYNFDEAGDMTGMSLVDSTVPETLIIPIDSLMDDSGNVDTLDLAEFAWFFKSIEEVA